MSSILRAVGQVAQGYNDIAIVPFIIDLMRDGDVIDAPWNHEMGINKEPKTQC
jgi:hypothetical protein